MHRFLLPTVALLAALAAPGGAQAPASPPASTPPSTAQELPATPPQTTAVHGDVPDLTGRWLFLGDLDLNGKTRTVPSFYDITREAGQLQVMEHFVNLPIDINKDLEQAQEGGEKWEPSPETLEKIRTDWNELPSSERGVRAATSELWTQEALDDALKKEEITSGAVWVLRQKYEFVPGGNRPATQVNVFTGNAREGDGWTGRYTAVAVVAAPFPVPISFKGSLRMIRLGEVEQPGLFARLLDMLKGCGR